MHMSNRRLSDVHVLSGMPYCNPDVLKTKSKLIQPMLSTELNII